MESTAPLTALSVSPTSLAAAFATVPDPRRAGSVIYPLPAMLTLAVAAILANHLSVLAIAEWGARQRPAVLTALGFPAGGCRANPRCSAWFANSTGTPSRRP